MANVLDPFVAEEWFIARLLDTVGATCEMGGQTVSADAVAFCGDGEADPPTIRVAPARDGFSPREFLTGEQAASEDADSLCWPYILVSEARDVAFERCGQENVLADGEYLVRSFHREDVAAALEGSPDVETANWPGYVALQNTFQGAKSPRTTYGIVHGCEIIRTHRRLTGEPGQRVSELGVVVRIFTT